MKDSYGLHKFNNLGCVSWLTRVVTRLQTKTIWLLTVWCTCIAARFLLKATEHLIPSIFLYNKFICCWLSRLPVTKGVLKYHSVLSVTTVIAFPDSKIHGANMGPIWGRQDPDESHVGPMNFAIWVATWLNTWNRACHQTGDTSHNVMTNTMWVTIIVISHYDCPPPQLSFLLYFLVFVLYNYRMHWYGFKLEITKFIDNINFIDVEDYHV